MIRLLLIACTVLAWVPAATAGTVSGTTSQNVDRPDLLELLPDGVMFAVAVDDASKLRKAEAGRSILSWAQEHGALPQTRRAWGLLAERMGIDEPGVFDRLLGRATVLGIAPHRDDEPLAWIVLAEVEQAFHDRLVRRSRAVPRRVVHGRTIFGLEEESFLLASLPPTRNGLIVVAIAPSPANWLLEQTLKKADETRAATPRERAHPVQRSAVRGFWKPSPRRAMATTSAVDLLDWFGGTAQLEPIRYTIDVRGRTLNLVVGEVMSDQGLAPASASVADVVLLDVVGPGNAIMSGVLERAGLRGLVPSDMDVTGGTGELVVRRAGEGVDLGARLPIARPTSIAETIAVDAPDSQVVHIRDLSETPSARRVFGPRPAMAWTTLNGNEHAYELVVAVTAGAATAEAPASLREAPNPNRSPAKSVAIVLEAAARPSPRSSGVHGSANPRALGTILRSIEEESDNSGPEFASLAFLFARARWAIDASGDAVFGRIVLDLPEPKSPK